jgi:hypothetical protein
MAAIEHEATTTFPLPGRPSERAIFVTDNDRRARRLRCGAALALVLSCLWLVGLAIGMLGMGSLPGLSLPIPGREAQPRADERAAQRAARVERAVPQRARTATLGVPRTEDRVRFQTATRSTLSRPAARRTQRGARTRPATRPRVTTTARPPVQPGQAAQAPPNPAPAPARRGLLRRGVTSPPGQTRSPTQPQPPAEPRSSTRPQPPVTPGQAGAPAVPPTSTTPAATVPLPPAQPDKPPPKS